MSHFWGVLSFVDFYSRRSASLLVKLSADRISKCIMVKNILIAKNKDLNINFEILPVDYLAKMMLNPVDQRP